MQMTSVEPVLETVATVMLQAGSTQVVCITGRAPSGLQRVWALVVALAGLPEDARGAVSTVALHFAGLTDSLLAGNFDLT